MATLDAFEPDIAVQVAGCSSILIERAVLNAAIEFCQRTRAWNIAQPSVAVLATDFPYAVPVPTDGDLFRVMTVNAGGVPLEPVSEDTLDKVDDWRATEGVPSHWLMEDSDNLLVYPLPAESTALLVRAAYKPSRAATTVPDFLFDDHYETIQAGALARLLLMPKRDWTDMQLGLAYAQKFTDDAEKHKSAVSQSLSRSVRRVRTHFV